MSVPKPRPEAYLRRMRDQRLQLQVGAARAMLRAKRWQLRGFVAAAAIGLAAIGGAAALLFEKLFGR